MSLACQTLTAVVSYRLLISLLFLKYLYDIPTLIVVSYAPFHTNKKKKRKVAEFIRNDYLAHLYAHSNNISSLCCNQYDQNRKHNQENFFTRYQVWSILLYFVILKKPFRVIS